jgi:hypothetical protein
MRDRETYHPYKSCKTSTDGGKKKHHESCESCESCRDSLLYHGVMKREKIGRERFRNGQMGARCGNGLGGRERGSSGQGRAAARTIWQHGQGRAAARTIPRRFCFGKLWRGGRVDAGFEIGKGLQTIAADGDGGARSTDMGRGGSARERDEGSDWQNAHERKRAIGLKTDVALGREVAEHERRPP